VEKYSPYTSSSKDWTAKLEQKEASELAARRLARQSPAGRGWEIPCKDEVPARRQARASAWCVGTNTNQDLPWACGADCNRRVRSALLRLGSATTATAQPSILGGTFNGS